MPNNAVLVVAGDIDMDKTKEMVQNYFGTIPRGKDIERVSIKEDPIQEALKAEAFDSNIQIPAIITAYRTPSFKSRESRVLDMISTYLSDGPSSLICSAGCLRPVADSQQFRYGIVNCMP